jgi:hypothetical protein
VPFGRYPLMIRTGAPHSPHRAMPVSKCLTWEPSLLSLRRGSDGSTVSWACSSGVTISGHSAFTVEDLTPVDTESSDSRGLRAPGDVLPAPGLALRGGEAPVVEVTCDGVRAVTGEKPIDDLPNDRRPLRLGLQSTEARPVLTGIRVCEHRSLRVLLCTGRNHPAGSILNRRVIGSNPAEAASR